VRSKKEISGFAGFSRNSGITEQVGDFRGESFSRVFAFFSTIGQIMGSPYR
jgi:hypothetical protein